MPVTMRIIIPESGSSLNPHGTVKLPRLPLPSISGIFGIHVATTTSCTRASPSSPSSWKNDSSDRPSAPAIVTQATSPETVRLKKRTPSTPLMRAPMPGSRGINQIRSTRSPFHDVHFVDVDGFLVPVEREDDPQPYRRLRRRDRDDEEREHLPDRVVPLL